MLKRCTSAVRLRAACHLSEPIVEQETYTIPAGQSGSPSLTSVQPCLSSLMRQISAVRTRLSALHVADSTERAIEGLATTLSASRHHHSAMSAVD